jgi:nucleotide-binding universal stress UspA family protein
MLERVLVPLDGAEESEAILPVVTRLVDPKNCRITLLRVISPVPAYPGLDLRRLTEQDRRDGRAYLRNQVKRLEAESLQVRARILEGEPAAMIVRAAREDRATSIAMATHGHGRLWRWALGSVADQVLRQSKVPVLLVRSTLDWPPSTRKASRILFPVDGRRSSRILPWVRTLADFLKAEVSVLPVEPERHPLSVGQPGTPDVLVPAPPRARKALPVLEALKSVGVAARAVEASGEPVERILEAAAGAELIVMGGEERPRLARWIGGGLADRVARASSIPVVIVPAGARKAAAA